MNPRVMRLPVPRRASASILLALLVAAADVPAAPLRLAAFNIEQGFDTAGTASHEQAKAVIARVRPDVLAVVEARGGTDITNFFGMATALGYSNAVISGSSALDTTLRTGIFSRHPIVSTNVVQSPSGAVELTRQFLGVKIDVPGTPDDPLVVVVHPKCCSSSSGQESFRRAIELRRTREFIQANSLPAIHSVFVVGDYNLVGTDNAVFNALPSGLPSSYRLGADVTFPVTYRTNPAFYFAGLGLEPVAMAQVNGQTKTWSSRNSSGSVLDYIVASAPVRARGYQTEIYNSLLDNGSGLPKPGPVPATNASSVASDHYLIFGDFILGGPEPSPVIQWPSASAINAGQTLGDSVLSGGAAAIGGSFAFADPAFVPSVGTNSWSVVFTPQNLEDYTPVSQAVPVAVLGPSGAGGFEEWSGGLPREPAALRAYAVGGAAAPSAVDAIPPTTSRAGGVFALTAVVRTNDPKLAVTAWSTTDLTRGPWTTQGIVREPDPDQSGVPAGFVREVFSMMPGTNPSMHMRLQVVLDP